MTVFLEYHELEPVEIRPYDPKSAEVFDRVKDVLQRHFPGKGIIHFGSTAVPGLRGKGVIDLFILAKRTEFGLCVDILESLGFQYPPVLNHGVMLPHRPKRVATFAYDDSIYRIHVSLTTPDSEDHRNALRFVAALRRSGKLREGYQRKKEEAIAAGLLTSREYADFKGEFIEEFLSRERETPTR